jgi:hypothetical protein
MTCGPDSQAAAGIISDGRTNNRVACLIDEFCCEGPTLLQVAGGDKMVRPFLPLLGLTGEVLHAPHPNLPPPRGEGVLTYPYEPHQREKCMSVHANRYVGVYAGEIGRREHKVKIATVGFGSIAAANPI